MEALPAQKVLTDFTFDGYTLDAVEIEKRKTDPAFKQTINVAFEDKLNPRCFNLVQAYGTSAQNPIA